MRWMKDLKDRAWVKKRTFMIQEEASESGLSGCVVLALIPLSTSVLILVEVRPCSVQCTSQCAVYSMQCGLFHLRHLMRPYGGSAMPRAPTYTTMVVAKPCTCTLDWHILVVLWMFFLFALTTARVTHMGVGSVVTSVAPGVLA